MIAGSRWSLEFKPISNDEFTGVNSVQGFINLNQEQTQVNEIYLNMELREKEQNDEKMWSNCLDDLDEISNKTRNKTLNFRGNGSYTRMETLSWKEQIIGENFKQDTERMNYDFQKIDEIDDWSRVLAGKVRDISYRTGTTELDNILSTICCLIEQLNMGEVFAQETQDDY
uniref:Uncharacterized protein n=1 Tax=Strongyloides papillosus TaxID=174720 RepID=A0A0N5CII5_STREA